MIIEERLFRAGNGTSRSCFANFSALTFNGEYEMMQVTEAIYSEGVLKPLGKLSLRETQRVRLIIEPLDGKREGGRSEALERLLAGIGSMEFFSGGRLPTREELH